MSSTTIYTELLQEKRLGQAAWLLRNTDKRVDEIANAVATKTSATSTGFSPDTSANLQKNTETANKDSFSEKSRPAKSPFSPV